MLIKRIDRFNRYKKYCKEYCYEPLFYDAYESDIIDESGRMFKDFQSHWEYLKKTELAMGDMIATLSDDFDEYNEFCEDNNIIPIFERMDLLNVKDEITGKIYKNFYSHWNYVENKIKK